MAGPFEAADFEKLIPVDKKLDPKWIAALFERGRPEVYRGAELDKIGMPIGGICAGQLYLGGDGRLWHWDLFNTPDASEMNQYVGARYQHPRQPASPLEQGFALKVLAGGKTSIRPLDRRGFHDIEFRGEYPIARVEYRDPRGRRWPYRSKRFLRMPP